MSSLRNASSCEERVHSETVRHADFGVSFCLFVSFDLMFKRFPLSTVANRRLQGESFRWSGVQFRNFDGSTT